MKIPAIRKLAQTYSLAQLQQAEQQLLAEEALQIEVEGEDEGEQLTHVLGAIQVLEEVQTEASDLATAIRNFAQRVRDSLN